jgi:F-type H+-transporting ATPase subunit b
MYILTFIFNTLIIAQEKPALLSVNPGLIIWTMIIFFLLLLLLRKIAWKPLISALNTREESIRDTIDHAERLKAEAEVIMEENKKNLTEANVQSMKIINESKEMANKMRDEIIAKANEESRKIIDHVKEEIKHEKESALEDLRNEVSDLAIKAAEKIINENLDTDKQKRIVNEFIEQIPRN